MIGGVGIGAAEIATSVRAGEVSAMEIAERCLEALERDGHGAVTRVLADRAMDDAGRVDSMVAAGADPGPLAGVPYAVKDLFDVAGLPTTAGSALYAAAPPAEEDAEAVRRLHEAGAVLVATLNMDALAYGFATVNAHHGTTRNPHDPTRLCGGSSGGSAAAVAAGLVPFALGSDTNGSIRVPASLTGLYGLKPTHGAASMEGAFPLAQSFDDIGPFTTSIADMRLVWGVLADAAGADTREPRLARLGGRFRENADPDQLAAIDAIAPDAPVIELPDVVRARSAAVLITAFEGGALHRTALARDAMAFDPQVRDRLLAGALLPDALYERAQAFRAEFVERVLEAIGGFDILLAPAAPCVAPPIADPVITIDGESHPARADLGIHTQPVTFAGLPSLAVPLLRPGRLPLGLQLIGHPYREATLFDFAETLEAAGFTGVSAPDPALVGELK
jgi:aspartyl-tRNA(Asn)/glutamyl-tRNA(Gln) amidotransferase subunit A